MIRCPKCGGKSWKRTKEESLNTPTESSWTVYEEKAGLQVEEKKLNNQATNSKDTIVNNSQETMMNNSQETMVKNSQGRFVKNCHGLMESSQGSSVKSSQDPVRKSCLNTASQGTTVVKKLGIFEAWKLPLGPWMAPLGAWRQPVRG